MKRFTSILLALIIIMAFIPLEGLAKSIYSPSLSIESSNIPSVNAGSTSTIELIIKNKGSITANNLVITPTFNGDSPFTPNNLTESLNVGDVLAQSQVTVKLSLSVSKDALQGTYPIPLNIKYNYININDTEDGFDRELKEGQYNETIYIRVSNQASQGRLIIKKIVTNPNTILADQAAKVSILFENKGTIDVNNVSAKLEGLDKENGFYLDSGSDVAYIKKVNGNSTSYIDFFLKSSKKISRGAHELKVTFKYDGKEETQTIFLNVGGESVQGSNLLIENLKYPTNPIPVNGNYTLDFDLRNNGGSQAKNILVKVESQDPSAVVPKSTSITRLPSLNTGASESLRFIFTPTPDAITRNYPLSISVEYEDDLSPEGEKRPILNQFVGVYAKNDPPKEDDGENEDDVKKGTPRLIIDKHTFSPSMARAGENFTMNLSFYNTNKSKSIENIKIFLTAESGANENSPNAGSSVFTPVDSSNTFYIDYIAPKQRVNQKITMFTIPDALAKTHTITANLEYEDSEGNEYTAKELIGVPVVQQSRLEVGELASQQEGFIGEPMPISVDFYNTGKVTLYNLMVKLEGDFDTENPQHYVGNFESGKSDYFDSTLIPFEPGLAQGTILFTYEDSTGEVQEFRKNFEVNVVDMPPMDEFDPDMDFMPEEEKGSIFKSPWFWIPVIIILIIAGVLFRRHRKKKRDKELTLDE